MKVTNDRNLTSRFVEELDNLGNRGGRFVGVVR
jgi:hypothetical protein